MEFSQCDSSVSHNRPEKVLEAGDLLEESWFFGNFHHHTETTKTISRCYSHPCPSSTSHQQSKINDSGLINTPSSFPTNSMPRGEFSLDQKERFFKSTSRPKLARAPSLPSPTMIRDEYEDDHESEFTMGRLIRQASLRSSDTLPPRQHSKVITQSISIPRQHSRKKAGMQSKSMEEGCKDIPTIQNQEQIKGKSTSDIEFEQLKGFKDLGLTFEKEELNPRVRVRVGLQEKSRVEQLGEGKLRRKHSKQKPYLSETWRAKSPSSPPRIPGSGSGRVDKSSAEDMKAQIKFWARAVASNVRQEC